MAAVQIKCPKCGEEISITDALSAQVETNFRDEYQRKARELERQIAAKEKSAAEKSLLAEEKIRDAEQLVAAQVAKEREKITAEIRRQEREQATNDSQAKILLLEQQAVEREAKIKIARETEIAALKKEAQLQNEREEFEAVKIRERLEMSEKLREEITKKISSDYHTQNEMLKKQLADAERANLEVQRKLEQGSQQTQGEISELQLENLLREKFPDDEIAPVPKGVIGADVIQTVRNRQNVAIGKIIWESKNTKAWGKDWTDKLKNDQRAINADLAIIVSNVLPAELKDAGYGMQDDVFICEPRFALIFIQVSRQRLLAVAKERHLQERRHDIQEQIYDYVTGTQFRQRVEAIVSYLRKEEEILKKERTAMIANFAKRQKHLELIGENLAGIYGDFSGFTRLEIIPTLELAEPEN